MDEEEEEEKKGQNIGNTLSVNNADLELSILSASDSIDAAVDVRTRLCVHTCPLYWFNWFIYSTYCSFNNLLSC